MTELNQIRDEINIINNNLVELFEKRIELVKKVAKYKIENNMDILDKTREDSIKNNIISSVNNENNKKYIINFIEEVMAISREYQTDYLNKEENYPNNFNHTINVAGFPGEQGSYSEQAFIQYFNKDKKNNIKEIACATFEDVVKKIINNSLDAGVLPIENSSTGTVNTSLDLIRDNNVHIIGEEIVYVEHNLCSINGSKIEDIETIYSHPQAFEQCREYLKKKTWNKISFENTSTSAKYIMNQNNKKYAAICSRRAAEIYGLDILESSINTNKNNYTRFVIIAPYFTENENANKISLTFMLPHKEGSLYKVLEVLNNNNINLLKLESRPEPKKTWKYRFFVDLEGNLSDVNVINAIAQLDNVVLSKRILGNYVSYNKNIRNRI